MKTCPKCGLRLTRGRTGDKTELNTTKIDHVELWLCTNKNCDYYAGSDLSEPNKIAIRDVQPKESVDF